MTRFMARGMRALCALGLLLIAVAGVSRASEPPAQAWPMKAMPITFWCGPPDSFITVEQYRRIADAGFNVVGPPCEGAATVERNRKILDTARATGLKAIIQDGRMPLALTGHPDARAALKAIVSAYSKHAALLGYFVTDEPGADSFAGLAEVVAELRKLDPNHLVYINLFPNYASTDRSVTPSQLNAASYDDYVAKFVATVQPQVLSWDHYFFLKGSDRQGFLGNLASCQHAASIARPSVPMWQVVLSVEHLGYRALSENELRFEAMQTLVYGGKGLSYFTYWPPPDDSTTKWSHAIMNRDGTEGPLYAPVRNVNREVRAFAKALYHADALSTFQTGDVPADGRPQPDDVPVHVTGAGNLSVGVFRTDDGALCVFVTNRDYKGGATPRLAFNAGARTISQFDAKTERWQPLTAKPDADGITSIDAPLDPAGAALFLWR